MPKPRAKTWKSQYNDDDFRAEPRRHVSFKRGGIKHERGKDWSASIRAHLEEEEDVDMGAVIRYQGKGNMRNRSALNNQQRSRRKLIEGPTGWYRVYIPYGNKYDKQFLTQAIMEKLAPTPFTPILWTANGTAVTFYVDEFKCAEKLNNIDREIQLPNGFKLILRVNSGTPHVDVTSAMKEKMKLAMAKRYNGDTKALDLTQFHMDPDLLDSFCALFKPIILLAVIDIISENIPELEALNLNNNKIQILHHLKHLNTKLPNLKILHLGSNKLREISQLDNLNGLPVVDLMLDGNPLCDKFREQALYISEVRKRFPKVIKLDGIDLPPPISFDIEEFHIPAGKQTYLCNPEGQGIVREFLEQYFVIMDGDNRQSLMQAYHENAMFSMTMSYPYGQNPKNSSWLNWYNTDNRNLLRLTDGERRSKLLKQGHLQIVAFLQEMPKTKHDIHSFTVDLNVFTPQMLLVVVTGVFKERKHAHKIPPIRYFYRSFVIIPSGSGFCISNEELHVSNATEEQIKKAFLIKTPTPDLVAPTPATSPVSVPASNAAAPVVPDEAIRQQMIQAMSQESNMNVTYSQMCLEQTQWDFQRAAIAFTEAKAKGHIPPEAFVK